jgi:hypothetical protein
MAEPRDQASSFDWENSLERKLTVYAVASGAFLAASASGSARAGIVYSPDKNVPIQNSYNSFTPTYFSFTVANPTGATADVGLEAVSGPGVGGSFLDGDTSATTALVGYGMDGVPLGSKLGSFTTISSGSNFGPMYSGYKLGKNKIKGGFPIVAGDWANGGIGFLGVAFQLGDGTHYGWIELAIDPTTLTGTLIEGAYESVAGMQITTPQAVPEPSSLGLSLLALGSVGVGALLRSRKQAATAAA